jgi:hypothetical protein
MGCIKMVQLPGYARPVPRFVAPECGPEAGPVEQWKPKSKGGYRKKSKKRPGDRERGEQLWLFPANEPRRTAPPMRNEGYDLPFTF